MINEKDKVIEIRKLSSRENSMQLSSIKKIKRFPKSKHGQMKIQEMSFMLLALVLFFIIAGLFFLIISNANLKKSAESLAESKAITVISTLAGSPELSCGESKQLCVDSDKLLALKQSNAFDKYWDTSGGLVVKKVYPIADSEIECNQGNYELCNIFTLKAKSEEFTELSSYVILCKKDISGGYSYDRCELGVISAYVG
jgi:hypothetical protein